MSEKYTPGPWFFGIAHEPERGPVPFDYTSLGYYDNPSVIGAEGTCVVGCDEYYVFNSPADARVIASAPELLEALEALVNEPTKAPDFLPSRLWDAARAAIAKARGQS